MVPLLNRCFSFFRKLFKDVCTILTRLCENQLYLFLRVEKNTNI